MDLSFSNLRDANISRANRWHRGFPDSREGWNIADWANAMLGEVGEAQEAFILLTIAAGKASNYIKKLRRHEEGFTGVGEPSIADLRAHVAEELADVVTYADLVASSLHMGLGEAVVDKFNKVSEIQGFPERL